MFPKIGLIILFILAEIILGVYSLIISESHLVKFLFFVATAIIIAYCITKFTAKALPSEDLLDGGNELGQKNHSLKDEE